jgi:hypothetical protein
MDIKRDDYIFIDIEWKTGFKHIVFCRGYNLEAQIRFTETIFWVKKFSWRVVTEKEYNTKLWAPLEEVTNERRKRKSKTLEENPSKGDSHIKANKDSKAVWSSSKRTAPPSKEARTELREPKVRTVRKSTKAVARTNDSGKKTPTRSRSSKSKAQ